MAPYLRHRGRWWQRLRRAVAGLTSRMVAPADALVASCRTTTRWARLQAGSSLRESTERLESRSAPVILDVRGGRRIRRRTPVISPIALECSAASAPWSCRRVRPRYRDRDLVLVCHTQIRSAQAAHLLNQAGFSRVSVLRGGMVEWRRQGLPVEGAGSAAGA